MRLGQVCVYSELIQISKIKLFVKLVNSRKLLTILAKSSILDVWLGSEYVFAKLSPFKWNIQILSRWTKWTKW